nr:hypothetical protein [Tanacetum cinerariifolium]
MVNTRNNTLEVPIDAGVKEWVTDHVDSVSMGIYVKLDNLLLQFNYLVGDVNILKGGEGNIGTHDDEAGSFRPKRTRQHETMEEAMLPCVYHDFLLWGTSNRAAKSRYNTNLSHLLPKHIYAPIKVYEMGGKKEIFSFEAWRRVFDINEPTYTELCHEFYSTYEFDEVIMKIAKKMGLLTDEVLNSLSAPTYCRALDATTLREPIDSNGKLIVEDPAPGMKRKGAGTQKESQICCGQFISKLARKCRELTEDVVRSLSAPICCRDLDTTTLRDLIDSDGKLIPDDPQLGMPKEAYNPPGYAQPQYDQYYQQYQPPPPRDLDTTTLRDLIDSGGKLIPDDPQLGVPKVAYDDEINLAFDENLILNEFAIKLCLDYEMKKEKKLVKKELIIAL